IPSRSATRIVTIYDLHFLDHPEQTTAEIRRDYPALAASHAQRADGVVVISKHTAQHVSDRFGIEPERLTICYPGSPAWARRAEPATTGPILFVGTTEPRKNLARLIEAYSALLQRRADLLPLVIAGAIPGSVEHLFAGAADA